MMRHLVTIPQIRGGICPDCDRRTVEGLLIPNDASETSWDYAARCRKCHRDMLTERFELEPSSEDVFAEDEAREREERARDEGYQDGFQAGAASMREALEADK